MSTIHSKNKNFIKYFLFLYLLAISGFEFFFRATSEAIYILFPIVSFLFIFSNRKFNVLFFKIISVFLFVFLLQSILFNSPYYLSITLLVRLLTVYFSISIIGKDFFLIFRKTIKLIAIISLIFYFLQYFNSFYNLFISLSENFTNLNSNLEDVKNRPNIIIYSIQELEKFKISSFYRNCGPFFEPGIFVVFLNIALSLNLISNKIILTKENFILIIATLTTFSTNGYIVIVLNLVFFMFYNRNFEYRVFSIIAFCALIPILINSSQVGGKIKLQIDDSNVSYSRFGAAVVHWNIVKDFPITGLPFEKNKKTYSKYADDISPNGITEIFLLYGIIGGIFYYYWLFRAAVSICKLVKREKKATWLFIIFVVVLFSQTQANQPIFWAIIFSQIPLSVYLEKKNRLQNI
jgi:hypothetical protein